MKPGPGDSHRQPGWLILLLLATGILLAGCAPDIPTSAPKEGSAAPDKANSKDKGGSSLLSGVTKNFKLPDYDSEGKLRSSVFGKEARNLTGDVIPITGLRVETYDADGKVELIVEAPECLFDRKHKSARSAGRMEARSADGMFTIRGEGFQWDQASGKLVLSNQVHTTINKKFLNQAPQQP